MKRVEIHDFEFLMIEWLYNEFIRTNWLKNKLRQAGFILDDPSMVICSRRDDMRQLTEFWVER